MNSQRANTGFAGGDDWEINRILDSFNPNRIANLSAVRIRKKDLGRGLRHDKTVA